MEQQTNVHRRPDHEIQKLGIEHRRKTFQQIRSLMLRNLLWVRVCCCVMCLPAAMCSYLTTAIKHFIPFLNYFFLNKSKLCSRFCKHWGNKDLLKISFSINHWHFYIFFIEFLFELILSNFISSIQSKLSCSQKFKVQQSFSVLKPAEQQTWNSFAQFLSLFTLSDDLNIC